MAGAHPVLPGILTVGRVNLDLYVADAGVSIRDATTYRASVGGSPANIAIVSSKLGIPSAVLSATGRDYSARFVRAELARHGVDTTWLLEKEQGATSLALLATLEPDVGERQFYRDNPADSYVELDVIPSLPWDSLRAVVISADSLARGQMARTAEAVAHTAIDLGVELWWDLDLRPSSWATSRRYADIVPAVVDGRSTIIGTEEEFASFFGVEHLTEEVFGDGLRQRDLRSVILKRGAAGAALYRDGLHAVAMPATTGAPVCTVGGGDATAGALVAARVAGLSWQESLELAMRVAGWTVRQPYCSTGFPDPSDLGIMQLTLNPGVEVQ